MFRLEERTSGKSRPRSPPSSVEIPSECAPGSNVSTRDSERRDDIGWRYGTSTRKSSGRVSGTGRSTLRTRRPLTMDTFRSLPDSWGEDDCPLFYTGRSSDGPSTVVREKEPSREETGQESKREGSLFRLFLA